MDPWRIGGRGSRFVRLERPSVLDPIRDGSRRRAAAATWSSPPQLRSEVAIQRDRGQIGREWSVYYSREFPEWYTHASSDSECGGWKRGDLGAYARFGAVAVAKEKYRMWVVKGETSKPFPSSS